LEGLEASEVRLANFLEDNVEFRLDAEYFSKRNMELNYILDNASYKKIEEIAFVTDGIHTSIDYSEESNIKLVSATSPRENHFDFSRNVFISKEAHLQNPRTALKSGDVIISTVGTIGNCAVITANDLPANSDRHVGIIRIHDKRFLSNYVSTFLVSKYGRFQTFRESTGNVQLNLFIYKIKTLKIADLPIDFQKAVDNMIHLAHNKRKQAQSLYRQAEELLLETLGLQDFQPSRENKAIKTLKESFLATGRLDAEYYQPKYEEIERIIKNYENGYCRLKDIGEFKNGSLISDELYVNKSKRAYIRIKELSFNQPISDDDVVFIDDGFVATNETVVHTNDFIFATIGNTIGKVNLVPEYYDGSFISNNTSRFRSHKIKYHFFYELLFRNILVQEQIQRNFTQTAQPKIGNESLENILIPLVDTAVQQEIAALIKKSFSLRQESERLLSDAKEMVEREIERGNGKNK
jgi:restriction endonuclease S subunit